MEADDFKGGHLSFLVDQMEDFRDAFEVGDGVGDADKIGSFHGGGAFGEGGEGGKGFENIGGGGVFELIDEGDELIAFGKFLEGGRIVDGGGVFEGIFEGDNFIEAGAGWPGGEGS